MGGGVTLEPKNQERLSSIDEDESDDDNSIASDDVTVDVTDDDNDSFLEDLGADKWVSPEDAEIQQKEQKKRDAEMAKMRREEARDLALQEKHEKARQKLEKTKKDENHVFTEDDIELLGRERLELIKRITQYKSQFPKELSKIRVPKKPTVEVLERILNEIDALLDLSTIDSFVLDSVYHSIRVIEGVSALTTRFNVSGLSDCLKKDPNFVCLAKRLMVKYSSYSQLAPEWQMLFTIGITAYVMTQKNAQTAKINLYLDEPIPLPKAPENVCV